MVEPPIDLSIKIPPVILAGGKGMLLWPLQPAAAAKQFIRFLVAEQAREIGVTLDGIILQPGARNTAAPVAAAVVIVAERHGSDTLIQFRPSDHEITVDDIYGDCVQKAPMLPGTAGSHQNHLRPAPISEKTKSFARSTKSSAAGKAPL